MEDIYELMETITQIKELVWSEEAFDEDTIHEIRNIVGQFNNEISDDDDEW